jgi:hypothetical protein
MSERYSATSSKTTKVDSTTGSAATIPFPSLDEETRGRLESPVGFPLGLVKLPLITATSSIDFPVVEFGNSRLLTEVVRVC